MLESVKLSQFISAASVVHRLPGRIRLRIPILEKMSPRWLIYSEHTVELIKMRAGIHKVTIQPIAGSVLIAYDPDLIEEADILSWLKNLVEIFIDRLKMSRSLNDADVLALFNWVGKWLTHNTDAPQYTSRDHR